MKVTLPMLAFTPSTVRSCIRLATLILAGLATTILHGAVAVARIDVEPSGGSLDEKPSARIAAQTPDAGFFAASGNRGDWTLGHQATPEQPAGRPFRQAEAVIMASLNELMPLERRGGVEVAGGLTAGSDPAGPVWVAGFAHAGNGVEANVDSAVAVFPFADGWIGAHVAKDGSTLLASGDLPEGTRIEPVRQGPCTGEVRLALGGVDALEDGMLFVVAAANGDNVAAVGPLPDGSAWHIRIADEGNNFRQEELCAFSVVYLPYRTPGLVGGWVAADGRILAGTGSFGVRPTAPGRYELSVLGAADAADGILLVQIAQMAPDGVEDNAIAWAYDPAANGGAGAFVIETYDQPGFQNQNAGFYVAYIPCRNRLTPPEPAAAAAVPAAIAGAATWADALEGWITAAAQDEAAAATAAAFRPFFSPVLRPKAAPHAVDTGVEGLPYLWLAVEPAPNATGGLAAWAEAAFILKDGSRQPLLAQAPVFASVPASALAGREVTLAGQRFASALALPTPALLAYAVPPEAVRFQAIVGLDDSADAGAAVQCRAFDDHRRRSPWQTEARPALARAYPTPMARFHEHIGTPRLQIFEIEAVLVGLERGITAMLTDLGGLAPALPDATDRLGLLRRYEACSRRLDDLARVEAGLWEVEPLLARLLDYPSSSLHRLRARLTQIQAEQPAQAAVAAARLAQFEDCTRQRDAILARAIAGDTAGLADLPALAQRLLGLAEWADRSRGWRTFRADNERSAISRERLTWPLRLDWTHTPAAPPAPAWPPPRADNPAVQHQLSPTLTYDHACHAVVADGRLFYGDAAHDAVVCLDAATGQELWRHHTGGPVRLAPALWADRVYAASDDGWIVCLQAATGETLWRYRPGPDGTMLPANERLVSAWPVRCGICIDRGTVYVGAGVFPTVGTYLCAVDALDGSRRWQEAVTCVPQGFMLLSPTRLFVPTGRTPFQVFDRETGKPLNRLGQSNSWGKDLPGGSSALIVNRTIATGPGEGGVIHIFDEKATESLLTIAGRQVIVDGLDAYVLQDHAVLALHRDDCLAAAHPAKVWEAPCPDAQTMIKVGDHLVIGGAEGIVVLAAADGARVGQVGLGGAAVAGLAWHDGRLVVSARDGRLLGLADSSTAAATAATIATPATRPAPAAVAAPAVTLPAADAAHARAVLEAGVPDRGYALVLGLDPAAVALALGLVDQSRLQCVLAGRDAAACQRWREAIRRGGLPGARLTVLDLEGEALPCRPYLFNLVVAAEPGLTALPERLRVLRPCGGILLDATPPDSAAALPPGEALAVPPGSGLAFAFRRGALPGAGRWTHGYADPANTACSGDAMPYGAFDLLWFGRPGPQYMYERHVKAAAPLCDNGLLFVNGKDYLAGLDAYNGTLLWERHEPGSGRMAMHKDCGNLATADGVLYAAVDSRCLAIEGRTGATQAAWSVPGLPPDQAHWGYIAVIDDLVLGSATPPEAKLIPTIKADYGVVWYHHQPVITSRALFALRRTDGTTAWTYTPPRGAILNATLTVLDGLLCFVESTQATTLTHPTGKIPLKELFEGGPELVAIEVASGRQRWRQPIDLDDFHHTIFMAGSQGTLVLTGTRHADVNGKTLIQYQLVGIRAATGQEAWRNDNTPTKADILNGGHGEQTQHPAIVGDVIYGSGFARRVQDGTPHPGWSWQKSPQCASLSASTHCAFSRQGGNPTVADWTSGSQLPLTRVTRPGCLINTIPASGIVAIPEASSGCTCPYPVQTSLALCPRLPPTPPP
ncbi:MAG: PQQ-binding-like beta-propeller repeat protein [Lentisphaerae bacterium]|nr:PQQ-binding-like beta-propeller repeat protein [Lentisphaerota bacterium]